VTVTIAALAALASRGGLVVLYSRRAIRRRRVAPEAAVAFAGPNVRAQSTFAASGSRRPWDARAVVAA